MGVLSKAREISRTFSPTRWAILAIAVVLVLILAAWLITWPGRQAQKTADAEAGKAFGEARTNSAVAAIGTVVNNANQAGQIDDRVKGSEDAIRSAPADQRDRVAVDGVCQSPSARRLPECRVLDPGAGGLGGRHR